MNKKIYYLYIVECVDRTLYTGITTDVERRILEHNQLNKGAKYTRRRRPVRLLCSYPVGNRSQASVEEYRVKKLSRKEKYKLSRFKNDTEVKK
tara:strand:- start:162 stop:440 length:279 start_codon:yes stop_codon:yes gene_type:complete